jgi:hypothetical protein
LGLRGLEQPGPEILRTAEIAQETGPELADGPRRYEEEDVVRLRLPHEFAHEVGAHLGIGIVEAVLELLERQIAVPEK